MSNLLIRVVDNYENRLLKLVNYLENIHNQSLVQNLEGFKKGVSNSGKNYYICNPLLEINANGPELYLYNSIMIDSKLKGFHSVMFLIN